MERPLEPYFEIFREKGIFYEQKDGTLTVQGLLEPGVYRLPGNVSSQFFTGLLYALPLLSGPSAIIPTTELESEGYIHMTLQAMAQFGVEMVATMSLPPQYHPAGNQTYTPEEATVEADWSQAGFWYAAKSLGNEVDIINMNPDSLQLDKMIVEYARMIRGEPLGGGGLSISVEIMGREESARAKLTDEELAAQGFRRGEGCAVSLDVGHCPDLVPPLAVMGALMKGQLRLKNAARLRMKESDRLAAVTDVLCKLGAKVTEGPDFLNIEGLPSLPGGVTVDAHNDHRIAMMAAIVATACERPVTITGAECVSKSYPNFWEDYVNLGGQIQQT